MRFTRHQQKVFFHLTTLSYEVPQLKKVRPELRSSLPNITDHFWGPGHATKEEYGVSFSQLFTQQGSR
jgi:hypothetical protein